MTTCMKIVNRYDVGVGGKCNLISPYILDARIWMQTHMNAINQVNNVQKLFAAAAGSE